MASQTWGLSSESPEDIFYQSPLRTEARSIRSASRDASNGIKNSVIGPHSSDFFGLGRLSERILVEEAFQFLQEKRL
ncbi:MAG: hypothetical protein ACYC9S_11855 [Leptospirales bacterium]